jgi:hypothetical protein
MAVSSSGRFPSRARFPAAGGPQSEEALALLAWRRAVQSAHAVLLEASRLSDGAYARSENGVRVALSALLRLEASIDGELDAARVPPPSPGGP